jgi:putative transposase
VVVRKRLDFEGSGLFFITATVVDWLPLFQRAELASLVLHRFSESTSVFRASVVAYVLMPSHFHTLVGFEEIRTISQFMRSFKSLSSKDVKGHLSAEVVDKLSNKGSFALWQPRFDDLLIYSEEQFKIKVEYIHTNPVKAGLVNESVEYDYSSARDWLLGEQGLVPVDKSFSWVR